MDDASLSWIPVAGVTDGLAGLLDSVAGELGEVAPDVLADELADGVGSCVVSSGSSSPQPTVPASMSATRTVPAA